MRRALILVAALLLAGACAGPSQALTREQAKAVALRTLKPQALKGRIVLFGLPKPLGATQSVAVAGPTRLGLTRAKNLRPVTRKAWLFWLDRDWGARFEHRSTLLLVDDQMGFTVRRELEWFPLVDGLRPAFLRSPAAYRDRRHWVYTNLPLRRHRAASSTARPAQAPLRLPPGAFKDDCLIMIGSVRDPMFRRDFIGMEAFAQRVGLRHFYATAGRRPTGELPPSDLMPGGISLASNVDDLVRRRDCKDVLIYMSGHGIPGPTPRA